ncbi:MAG: hypothetical protein Q9173_003500 [Seirophora scorigena]
MVSCRICRQPKKSIRARSTAASAPAPLNVVDKTSKLSKSVGNLYGCVRAQFPSKFCQLEEKEEKEKGRVEVLPGRPRFKRHQMPILSSLLRATQLMMQIPTTGLELAETLLEEVMPILQAVVHDEGMYEVNAHCQECPEQADMVDIKSASWRYPVWLNG